MIAKVALITGAVVIQVAVMGGLIWLLAHDDPRSRPAPTGITPKFTPRVDVLAGWPELPLAGAGWRLVDQLSAHYALILDIEAENLPDAKAIAQHLTEPIKDSYNEVLVYFYLTGGKDGPADRRVQWTATDGYVEVSLRP